MIQKKPIAIQKIIKINEIHEGQRIDNFLINILNGIPKSKIYNLIRKGKIKLNNKIIYFYYKLKMNDVIYIPSLYYIHTFFQFNVNFINKQKKNF